MISELGLVVSQETQEAWTVWTNSHSWGSEGTGRSGSHRLAAACALGRDAGTDVAVRKAGSPAPHLARSVSSILLATWLFPEWPVIQDGLMRISYGTFTEITPTASVMYNQGRLS